LAELQAENHSVTNVKSTGYTVESSGTVVLDNDLSPILEIPKLKVCDIGNKRTYNVGHKYVQAFLKSKYCQLPDYDDVAKQWEWYASN